MTDRTGGTLSLPPVTPLPDNAPYVRLHVAPLDADLIKAVLSSALLPKARNISYHTIETFPDKRYGFLELPNDDAEKLKKKFNGSVVRGVKIRIGSARPSRLPTPLAEEAMAKEKTSKKTTEGVLPPKDKKDKSKKRKRDIELSGVVLEEGRTVKRGWTSADEPKEKRSKKDKEKKSKDKKKQSRSKYTEHAECLIKTVLPANAAPSAGAEDSTPTKKKKGKSREVVIHEFERTTKFPTFLKAVAPVGRSGAPPEFVEGKGWVNEDGDVVEAVNTRPPPAAKILLSGKSKTRGQKPILNEESSSTNSSDDEPAAESEPETPAPAADGPLSSEAAASETSSPSSPVKSEPPRPRSSGSVRSLSIRIPPATPSESKVHPLEALYKRSQQPDGETPKAAPDAQGFSFFANDNEGSAGEDVDTDAGEAPVIRMPLTPFTRQDLESRGVRSAAPTPDTAHPNRRFTPWEPANDNEDEEDEELGEESEEEEPSLSNSAATQGGENDGNATSDFQKWFWANRGDLNRSWKKRRKTAGKEKRYRENKARMARAI